MAQLLVLLRHGLIAANREGVWHGSTDSPLLAKGKRQAKRVGKHIAAQPALPAAVYTSPLQRCQETATLVTQAINASLTEIGPRARWSSRLHTLSRGRFGAALAPPATGTLEPVVIDDLREYAIGEWEGLAFSELARTHQFLQRATADMDYAPPQGESLRQVSERIAPALMQLHERHGPEERIVIVAHGVVLAVGLATILNNDPAKWLDYHIDNCSLSELALGGLPELQRLNFTGHL